MHEKSPLLQATTRDRIGSRYSARERAKGRLPAIVYGHGRDPLPISVESRAASRLIMKGEKVFRLDFPGQSAADEMQMVLLKDLQFDHLGSELVHCDFVRVDLNERVKTRVHVNLTGDAIGLKQAGSILMHAVAELEIECRVVDLPDSIDVNIATLDLGQSITAADVKLPMADMKLITDPHAVVAQIVIAAVQKTAEEETVAAGAAEPEVITAKKPAEGDAAKPGDKAAAGKAGDKAAAKPAADKGGAKK
jgi:large subunit ribosomal protein L25